MCSSDLMIKTSDANASGNKAIVSIGDNNSGYVHYSIYVPQDGTYKLWLRASAPDGGQNSCYFAFDDTTGSRSEERRVGKECRSRWSPYH